MTTPRIAVIGGGLSGLVAAYELRAQFADAAITVVETADRLGGKLHTTEFPSGPMEVGAEAFISRRPEASDLVRELGLTEQLRHPRGLSPVIRTGGRLVAMPTGTLMGLPSDPNTLARVLDPEDVARAAEEERLPLDWSVSGDVSLGDFVAERFGPAIVTRLVDPMLGGVYAASSRGLGLREVVPGLAAALDRGAPSLTAAARELVANSTGGPVFATLAGGYRELVSSLDRAARAGVVMNTRVTGLRRGGGAGRSSYLLDLDGPDGRGELEVDAVVLAVPVPHATPLLSGQAGEAARRLGRIRTASSAVVALEIARDYPLPETSGVLVAIDEPVDYKAMTFSSRKWPHLDDREGHLVRVSFGKLGDDEVLASDDDGLTRRAVDALTELGGVAPTVLHSGVGRWVDGLPEIGPDHRSRMAEIRSLLAEDLPGLELVGAATEGVGVPACIGSARAAGRRLADWWQD